MQKLPSLVYILSFAFAAFSSLGAYTTMIHAPAVLSGNYSGTLTVISLNITHGDGVVQVTGPQTVGESTLISAQIAAKYVSGYLSMNESQYNFTYKINDSSNVSGPSAGLAFSLLAYSGFKKTQLYNNFTVTGTINSNGTIGEVGGVYDKLQAAKLNGIRYALIPQVKGDAAEALVYYITQQSFNIPAMQVSNLSQALQYINASSINKITPIAYPKRSYNMTVPNASVTCSACNASYFRLLSNYTFGFTANEINLAGKNFAGAKATILNDLNSYKMLSNKGYLYAGANFAFLDGIDSFVLANSNNFNKTSAQNLLNNVSGYCSSLLPPQLTDLNYEYVIGGELRQIWGGINIKDAFVLVNDSQSTDDIIRGVYLAASSYGWCNGANEMYNIASTAGGNPVDLSLKVKTQALNEINSAQQYGSSIYLEGALEAYNSSEYGAALYSAAYALSVGNPQIYSNYTQSQLAGFAASNAANVTYGIWPSQFADSALFYLHQGNPYSASQKSNVTSAYSEAYLATALSNVNKLISSSFVPANTSQQSGPLSALIVKESTDISTIQSQIAATWIMIYIVIGLLIVVIIMLLVLIMRVDWVRTTGARRRQGRKD